MDRSIISVLPTTSIEQQRAEFSDLASRLAEFGAFHDSAYLETYPYRELSVSLNVSERIFWCWFQPQGRACFSRALLEELRIMQNFIRHGRVDPTLKDLGFDYMVVGSKSPGVFNLGGDLRLFQHLVREGNRDALRTYAKLCVDVVRDNFDSYGQPIVTIANVEGSCLGGGFEAALSCDVVISEEHVKFGFPEILFGLFPGMGAVNFLSRRLSKQQLEELVAGGRTYEAREMQDLGLVDIVVASGGGEAATRRYIDDHKKRVRPHAAVCASLRAAQQFCDAEFETIIDLWVSTAMRLSDRDLRKMVRLADAQARKKKLTVLAPA